MRLSEPQSAFHQRLEKIADNIAALGQPRAEVIAFYMCGFKPDGSRYAPGNKPKVNIVAKWLLDAHISSVKEIADADADKFRADMMANRPPHDPPLVRKIDGPDLLMIHAVAAKVLAAIEP